MLRYFTPAAQLMRDIERYRRRPVPMLCLTYDDGEPAVGVSLEKAALQAEAERLDARVRALTNRDKQIVAACALDAAAREWAERQTQQARALQVLITRRHRCATKDDPT
jgi:hypothetical protein